MKENVQFKDGAQAASAGHLITHCPYPADTEAGSDWIRGYQSIATHEEPTHVTLHRKRMQPHEDNLYSGKDVS